MYIKKWQTHVLNVLDIKLILHEDCSIKTDIYYKPTPMLIYHETISHITWQKEL